MGKRKRTIGVVLAVLGVVLVVFGAVWVTVIFPGISKIPANLNVSTYQEGTVTLFDADTQQAVVYNVINTRYTKAVRSTADTVYVAEDNTFVNADTGEDIPALRTSLLQAVDRVGRGQVPGHGDKDRAGQFAFPRNVEAGKDYPFWITGNPVVLDAKYTGEDKFEGLTVYVYEVATPEEGVTVPAGLYTPEQQLYQRVEMWVEPVSGTPVYVESANTRTTKIPVPDELFPTTGPMTYEEVTIYADDLAFNQETVDMMLKDARFYHWGVPWGATYLPLLVFVLGGLMLLAGVVLVTRRAEVPAAAGLPGEMTGVVPTK